MLEMRDLCCHCVSWKLFKHDSDVNKRVGASLQQHEWGLDVSSWEFGDLVVSITSADTKCIGAIIIVHLEGFISDDLEPVYD